MRPDRPLEITGEGRQLWQAEQRCALAAALDDALRTDPGLRSAVELGVQRRMEAHREPDGTFACDMHAMAGYTIDALLDALRRDEHPPGTDATAPAATVFVDAPDQLAHRRRRPHPPLVRSPHGDEQPDR